MPAQTSREISQNTVPGHRRLIESGLDAKEREKSHSSHLADRLIHTSDTTEQKRLKD